MRFMIHRHPSMTCPICGALCIPELGCDHEVPEDTWIAAAVRDELAARPSSLRALYPRLASMVAGDLDLIDAAVLALLRAGVIHVANGTLYTIEVERGRLAG